MILLMFGRMVEVSLKLGNILSYYCEAMILSNTITNNEDFM